MTIHPLKFCSMRRHVDETFRSFNNEEDPFMFFDFINARHPSIRSTMEREIDKKLLFPDMLFLLSLCYCSCYEVRYFCFLRILYSNCNASFDA